MRKTLWVVRKKEIKALTLEEKKKQKQSHKNKTQFYFSGIMSPRFHVDNYPKKKKENI
jgi:1,2-phenylacetyl-CoA epoxidase PaaB subunit